MPSDKATYREMSKPFDTPDEANAAVQAFFKDLGEIRRKHKIRDVVCVLSGSCIYPGQADDIDPEGEFITAQSYGNSLMRETLAAWMLGSVQAENRETVNKILAGDKRKKAAANSLFD